MNEIIKLKKIKQYENIPVKQELLNKYKTVHEIFVKEFNNIKSIFLNVNINELNKINDISISNYKKLAIDIFYKYNKLNYFENASNNIIVTKNGINESIEKIFNNYKQRNLMKIHLIVIAHLGCILKTSKLVNQAMNYKSNCNILHWNYYINKVTIEKNVYKIIFDIRSIQNGENQYRIQRIELYKEKTD